MSTETGLGTDSLANFDIVLNLLQDSASGRDVSHRIQDVIQAACVSGGQNAHVKSLVYDLCKAAPLNDYDCQLLVHSIRSDLVSLSPELAAAALRFIPSLPGGQLLPLITSGDLLPAMAKHLESTVADERGAAVFGLSRVLLMDDVLQTIAASLAFTHSFQEYWQQLLDCLLDPEALVVTAAAAAATRLLEAAGAASGATGAEDVLLQRAGARGARRIAVALGPVLEACSVVPATAQVFVIEMLGLVLDQLHRHPSGIADVSASTGGSSSMQTDPGLTPGLASIAPSVGSYLMQYVRCVDVGARLSACKVLLRIACYGQAGADAGGAGNTAAAAPAATVMLSGVRPVVPAAWPSTAVDALLELRELANAEAVLDDVATTIAGGIMCLPLSVRYGVLRQLWPLVARMRDVPQRTITFALVWQAAVQTEAEAQALGELGASSGLLALFKDKYVGAMLSGKRLPGDEPVTLSPDGGIVAAITGAARQAAAVATEVASDVATAATSAADTTASTAAQGASRAASGAAHGSAKIASSAVHGASKATSSAVSAVQGAGKAASSSASAAAHEVGAASKGGMEKLGGLWKRGINKIDKIRGSSGSDAAAAPPPPPVPPAPAAPASAEPAPIATTIPAPTTFAPASTSVAAAAPAGESAPVPPAAAPPPPLPPSPAPRAAAPVAYEYNAAGEKGSQQPQQQQGSTVRHEMLGALMEVLSQQPEALSAWEVVQEVSSATARDRLPALRPLSERDAKLVRWLGLTSGVLQATVGCLAWEPPVVPQISAQVSQAALKHVSADFSTLPADAWLQLLQLCCTAARSVRKVLELHPSLQDLGQTPAGGRRSVPPAAASTAQWAAGLMAALDQQQRELQQLIKQMVQAWPALSRAVRPRVFWVAVHAAQLPAVLDDTWALLLRCLPDLLPRGVPLTALQRVADLISSATTGVLYRSGRTATEKDRVFMFDVVAASALCEGAEYESTSVTVGLSCMQRLASLLHNRLAMAKPDAALQVHRDTAQISGKLDAILREFSPTDLAGSWHVRQWCKRLATMLLSIVTYAPPKPDEADATPKASAASATENVRRIKTDFGDLQNSSSDDDDDEDTVPPTPTPAPVEQPASGTGPPLDPEAVHAAAVMTAFGDANEFKSRLAYVGGTAAQAPPTYFGVSLSTSAACGYPFGAPRCHVLFNSKRGRRHRVMLDNIQAAASRLSTSGRPAHRSPDMELSAATAAAAGPALSTSGTPMRLDSPAFWRYCLPGHCPSNFGSLVELTGPGDPLLLRGSCRTIVDRSGGGGNGGGTRAVVVHLTISSRLDAELQGGEVHVRTSGPIVADRRGTVWHLPRLAPRESVSHSFQIRLLGFGRCEVQCRIQLAPLLLAGESVHLPCAPLVVPVDSALARSRTAPPVGAFLRQWSTLPARTEIASVCIWPGLEGQMLVLSNMLRRPLECVLLQHTPGTAGFQAAFNARTPGGDVFSFMLTTQMMPTPATINSTAALQGADATPKWTSGGPDAAATAAAAAAVAAESASGGRDADAFCHFYIRASSPEAVFAIQANASAFVRLWTDGAAVVGLQHPGCPAGARPPLHPLVAALQQSYVQSARASSAVGGGAGDAWVLDGGEATVAGSQVSQAWVNRAAVGEWQRLSALA